MALITVETIISRVVPFVYVQKQEWWCFRGPLCHLQRAILQSTANTVIKSELTRTEFLLERKFPRQNPGRTHKRFTEKEPVLGPQRLCRSS
ncbi:hypothetical protein LINPERPRIM_LOCUS2152 [Linum perenne]